MALMAANTAELVGAERTPRFHAPYENWRPPVVGVSLLVPVGMNELLLADTTGHGDLMLPTGSMEAGETPEQAAQRVLVGAPTGFTILRRVAVDQVQTRRRRVITHIVATLPLANDDAASLSYRDPRALLLSVPRARAVSKLPEQAGHRALIGLGCLSTGLVAHLEAGAICRLEAAPLSPQPDPG
ncbi:hypothetical protein ACIBO4_18140 [Streptomyces sp. NPDC050149]|uniref:hypothetical protein n=2 Tax=Streptomyces TaxID=1883 RepID=UPI0037AAF100